MLIKIVNGAESAWVLNSVFFVQAYQPTSRAIIVELDAAKDEAEKVRKSQMFSQSI